MEAEDLETITWQSSGFLLKGKPFVPVIYEGATPIPEGFNAIALTLNGCFKSTLDWDETIERADKYVSEGYKLFWHLDLGLFDKLHSPLAHAGQYSTLSLAIDHFRETIWSRFSGATIGVSLYRGVLDVNLQDLVPIENLRHWLQKWFRSIEQCNQQLHCAFQSFADVTFKTLECNPKSNLLLALFFRNVVAEYLNQLACHLPPDANGFIFGGLQKTWTPLQKVLLENAAPFKPLEIIIGDALSFLQRPEIKIAFCLPPADGFHFKSYEVIELAMDSFLRDNITFRSIPEEHLISHFEGLDEIMVCPDSLTIDGRRQLQGFIAAGGTVTYL